MIKRNLLVLGLATLLSACGFHLRGTGTNEMGIKELDIKARDAYGQTVNDLRSALERSGVKVVAGAPYTLNLTKEDENQRSATYTGSARSSEIELSLRLDYTITGDQQRVLIGDHMDVQKIYVHDSNNLAGSDQESARVRSEMHRELIQRMMLSLSRITPAQLEQLQAQADAKARADAAAEAEAQRIRDETPQQSPVEVPAQ
ncbi:LPS assembly lipoprotein LptE [Pseudomonas sp. RIT-PI-S]|uniref:LPS-assembly lipoprotein LptE n=1 Tax=Pseudomonas sp. RIT-PI-S TaxID=3035295 RepID=UPI0021DA6B0F|nr:LPS assembly lipoprotein LptE [Pseudomonas sp. RIT-PI-S]